MRRVVKTYQINRPLRSVKDSFTDLTKYAKLHPLVVSADLIDAESEVSIYRIREKPFRSLPISIGYCTRVIQGEDTIKFEFTGLPFNKPQIVYYLSEPGQGKTEVRLDLTLLGLPLVENVLLLMMMAAQDEIMSKLNRG